MLVATTSDSSTLEPDLEVWLDAGFQIVSLSSLSVSLFFAYWIHPFQKDRYFHLAGQGGPPVVPTNIVLIAHSHRGKASLWQHQAVLPISYYYPQTNRWGQGNRANSKLHCLHRSCKQAVTAQAWSHATAGTVRGLGSPTWTTKNEGKWVSKEKYGTNHTYLFNNHLWAKLPQTPGSVLRQGQLGRLILIAAHLVIIWPLFPLLLLIPLSLCDEKESPLGYYSWSTGPFNQLLNACSWIPPC